jgi:hypothetical protein
MQGHWRYEARRADGVYGEPEVLLVVIRVEGDTICGSLMSAWRGGMKVDDREFRGEMRSGVAQVEYGDEGEGRARVEVRMRGETLEWRVTAVSGERDYVLRRAILRRSKPALDDPTGCAK